MRFEEQANKIFLFEEVYPLSAAREQAERRKLSAFGVLARLNPLKRPSQETVQLERHELRLEPFWHIVARRHVDFIRSTPYHLSVGNEFATQLEISGHSYEVTRKGHKAHIEMEVAEHCHRKLKYNQFFDALDRDLRPRLLESYCDRYKYRVLEASERAEIVTPRIAEEAALQRAGSYLLGEPIDASTICRDDLVFEQVHLFLRPVFAFEYAWSGAEHPGVIEVNGLTGEVNENGDWFKDRVQSVLTRDMLIEAGSEMAGSLLPGAGVAVKVIGRLAE